MSEVTNPSQFKGTAFVRDEEDYGPEGGSVRRYYAFPQSKKSPGWHETTGASLDVYDYPSESAYLYGHVHRPASPGVKPEVHATGYSGSGSVPDAERDLLREPGGQMKLFGSHHEPAQSVVSELFSTRAARVHAPTLLAMAERDTRERFGHGLTASDDRSNFSEQLTQHLGALTGEKMVERVNTNNSMFKPQSRHIWTRDEAVQEHGEEVPAQEVGAARRAVRGMIRAGRSKPQGEQLPMPMQMSTPPPTAGRARRR